MGTVLLIITGGRRVRVGYGVESGYAAGSLPGLGSAPCPGQRKILQPIQFIDRVQGPEGQAEEGRTLEGGASVRRSRTAGTCGASDSGALPVPLAGAPPAGADSSERPVEGEALCEFGGSSNRPPGAHPGGGSVPEPVRPRVVPLPVQDSAVELPLVGVGFLQHA